MTLGVSLGGAHYPEGRPEEQRRLDVRVTVSLGSWGLSGVVFVEGVATWTGATGAVRIGFGGVHYELAFPADDGRSLALVVSHARGFGVRALTELSGSLASRDDGAVIALARLRFDARSALGW